jgi:ribosomal protein S1
MIDEQTWNAAKAGLPLGTKVSAVIVLHTPFGMFVQVPEVPDARVLIDAIAYLPSGGPVDPEQWPKPGETVDAVVVDHVENDREVKLRVGLL